jgi:ectoine hydroxylase-related dioxygenase (phytanoyl-CoA dioxygenase family)
MPDPVLLPPLDRPGVEETALTDTQRSRRRDGVVILRGFMPDALLDPYIARRDRLRTEAPELFLGGWRSPTPYEHVAEMRALALHPPLMRVLREVVGEEMLLHLALTGWVSTQRDWHQDDYLNPPFVNSWYAAVWFALDHIDPASGPFEYVPGSHVWPLLRGDKVLDCMTEEEEYAVDPISGARVWPATSQRFVAPAIEAEIARREVKAVPFLAEKGDVLIWHGRLMHRGSAPQSPTLLRKALITHYSGVNHRPDMPNRAVDANGMRHAVFGRALV